MTENVQCPVCTLYLHAGMDLSDHLETHPKEQVIRALVQMTISGSEVGKSNTLASVLTGESSKTVNGNTKPTAELDEKPTPVVIRDNELNSGSAGNSSSGRTSNSASNYSLWNQSRSVTNSQNSKNILNFSATKRERHNENEPGKTKNSSPNITAKTDVKAESSATTIKKDNATINKSMDQCFSKSNFTETNSTSNSATNASHLYNPNALELTSANNNIQNNFNLFGGNPRYDQQQRIDVNNQLSAPPHMPPPPPPPPSPAVSVQSQHSGQSHQEVNGGILPGGSSGTFNSLQLQQLAPPPPTSLQHSSSLHLGSSTNSHRQTHMFAAGQQHQHQAASSNSHHQQSLKHIYTPNLPPPPPLQLFTYQPQTHLQHHQKPPPAYGTAISQIRSQHNQSKHQMTGSLATQHQQQTLQTQTALQQHQQLQQHHLQHQQTIQHNIRIQVPPPPTPPPLPIPTKHHCLPKENGMFVQNNTTESTRHSQQQQQAKSDLSQHLQQNQEQEQSQPYTESTQNSNNHILNSNEISNKSIKGTAAAQNPNMNVPSALGRQSNSPFAALLAAAVGATSPSNASSVLRYAESPVAHYLERENGDFIVQETPKHIVECVEKDNGEFSVIERIYHSPPSVLHIHDDDDGDGDDENDNDKCEDQIEGEKGDNVDCKPKQHNINCSNKTKFEVDEKQKKTEKSSKEVSPVGSNKSNINSKFNDHIKEDNKFVDSVSISSDSGDEEEFISQEREDFQNTTEKTKKSQMSLKAMSTTAILTQSTSSLETLSPSLPTCHENDDQETNSMSSTSTYTCSSSLITSNTIQTQNSANITTNGSNRKKSSKNTITVLSDVQLNLNEYLDLVGNIIASSKVAAQRKSTCVPPIPLVKIEKEEAMDEYFIPTTTATNFETQLLPSSTNKDETDKLTDIPSCSNSKTTIAKTNHNMIFTNELEPDEQEDEKPDILESATDNEMNSNVLLNSSSCAINTLNSSQVTSVIRMATTSQHQTQLLQQLPLESNKNSSEAEDLSHRQRKNQSKTNSKPAVPTLLARKVPKKLVIKPKSSKTEVFPIAITANKSNKTEVDDDQEIPTTSAKARQENTNQNSIEENTLNTADVKVKSEPITSITYENQQQQQHLPYQPATSLSILEQHLSSKETIIEFKEEEKPIITEESITPTSIIKEIKVENNVNDDARVLYDFANSKKTQNETLSTFPSATSLFASKQTSIKDIRASDEEQQLTKELHHENNTTSSSSSIYSSQSAMDATMPSKEPNNTSVSAATMEQIHQQPNQAYTDFHFNYLYNNVGSNVTAVATADQTDIKNHQQFTTFYQNSTNNTMLLEDSSSSKHYTEFQQQQHQTAGTAHHHWFNNSNNYQTSETNLTPITSNHSVSLSADGNTVGMECTEVSKYLDLDSCKREQNIDVNVGDRLTVSQPPPPSSSTSCSFNGTTDNSMAGICSTGVTLNIRTDEKMPAKGEISEQESNCDIDNSWSQPMYGDISARFFKTTFPGIFPQDNGWNHEEYFAVQDLSASTTALATSGSSNRLKSFEPNNNSSSNAMPTFFQNSNDNCNIDVMPSTSAKIRKKRKRSSQDGKTPQSNGKRMQPTSTVTSQQLLMQHQNEQSGVEFNLEHHQLQQQHHSQQQPLQQLTTSTEYLVGSSNASSSLASGLMMHQQQQNSLQQAQPEQHQPQHKQRTKVYECGHCNAKYSKLKDRNAHMIEAHNYIRQNRKLLCPTAGLATPLINSNVQDPALPTTSAAGCVLTSLQQNADCMGDYKQGIVKLENDNVQRDLANVESINANLSAKAEIIEDNKQNLDLIPINGANADGINLEYDTKPTTTSLPLSLTTPTNKLTTLYRMLVSFNMTTLKQNQSLSEFDENLIKSSIFFCYICRQNFNSVKLYDAHLTEHPAECFTCGKKFQRWKNFSLHLKRHLGWKEFGCTVCEKKFVVRSALVEHMRMHSGLSPLKCKVCGKHFKRYSNLTQHRKRHTKVTYRKKEYVCYCGEVLPSKARFLWHKETHDSKPKCCPHCCDRFVHVNSLRRHIRLAHSDKFDYTEPMECPICKQIFAKASMKAHMATHSTDTQYDCAICNKSFSTKWNLKIHSWVHASRTNKPFKCEHCPKAFVREVDFKNHMNSHKQIKPYTCEVCGCKFIRKYNYMRHRREHHGNKKYTCDLCKKSFHRHYYLIEHRRIHTGERPFQCTICGKSSTTKTNHNKHLKIHHSRDPFTVEV